MDGVWCFVKGEIHSLALGKINASSLELIIRLLFRKQKKKHEKRTLVVFSDM